MNLFKFDAEPLSPEDGRRIMVPAGIANKAELLAFLQKALKLPDYFGQNWDALDECMTDPDWLEGNQGLILAHRDIPLKTPGEQKDYVLVLGGIAMETMDDFSIHFPEICRARVTRILAGE